MAVKFPYGLILGFSLLIACNNGPSREYYQLSDLQAGVIAYLSHPRLTGFDFAEQATGQRFFLERYDRKTRYLYITMDWQAFAESKKLEAICTNTSRVVFAKRHGALQRLDGFNYEDTSRVFFRFPGYLLRVDSTRTLSKNFSDKYYTLKMTEFRGFFNNTVLYNGPVLALVGGYQDGKPLAVANHCSTVAPYGEPSLLRWVKSLTEGVVGAEAQAQVLLDFVTEEIGYTGHGGVEIFYRPIEVILSERADCSGKVVLYASLLEQARIPFLLVYLPRHIAVAVPGDFSKENGLHFEHEGQTYFIAETTSHHFQIGESRLFRPYTPGDILYLQYPGKRSRLYDLAAQDSLEFLKRE